MLYRDTQRILLPRLGRVGVSRLTVVAKHKASVMVSWLLVSPVKKADPREGSSTFICQKNQIQDVHIGYTAFPLSLYIITFPKSAYVKLK